MQRDSDKWYPQKIDAKPADMFLYTLRNALLIENSDPEEVG
jgi:hypothetical protein